MLFSVLAFTFPPFGVKGLKICHIKQLINLVGSGKEDRWTSVRCDPQAK